MKKSLMDFWIRESMETGVEMLAGTSPVFFMAAVTDEFLRILKGISPEAAATSCDDS